MLSHIGGIWWTFLSSSPFYVQLDCSYWEVDCFKRYVKEQEPISLLTNSLLPLFVPLIVDMKQILTFLKLECSGDTHEIIKIHGQKLSFKWNAYRQSLLKKIRTPPVPFGFHSRWRNVQRLRRVPSTNKFSKYKSVELGDRSNFWAKANRILPVLWRKIKYLSWRNQSQSIWWYVATLVITPTESLVEAPLRGGILSECFECQSVSGVSGSIRLTSNWQHWLCSWWLALFVNYISRLESKLSQNLNKHDCNHC